VLRVPDDVINELIPIVAASRPWRGRLHCARLNDEVLAERRACTSASSIIWTSATRGPTWSSRVPSFGLSSPSQATKTLKKIYETLTIKPAWQSASHHALAEWRQTVEVQKRSCTMRLQIRDGDLWALGCVPSRPHIGGRPPCSAAPDFAAGAERCRDRPGGQLIRQLATERHRYELQAAQVADTRVRKRRFWSSTIVSITRNVVRQIGGERS